MMNTAEPMMGSSSYNNRMQVLANGDIVDCGRLPNTARNNLYKTELCKHFADTGNCRYGPKCQFAHGEEDLRGVLRHPKYKTTHCKAYISTGHCVYGVRCRFIHNGSSHSANSDEDEDDDDQQQHQFGSGSGHGRGAVQWDGNAFSNRNHLDSGVSSTGSESSDGEGDLSVNPYQYGTNSRSKTTSTSSNHGAMDLMLPFKQVPLTPLTSIGSSMSSSPPGLDAFGSMNDPFAFKFNTDDDDENDSVVVGLNSKNGGGNSGLTHHGLGLRLPLPRDRLSSSCSSNNSSVFGTQIQQLRGDVLGVTLSSPVSGNEDDAAAQFSRLSIFQRICRDEDGNAV